MLKLPRFMKEYISYILKDEYCLATYNANKVKARVDKVTKMYEHGSITVSEAMLLLVKVHKYGDFK